MSLGHEKYFDPKAMRFAVTLAGFAAPDIRSGCEIGFGGLSAAIAAACAPGSRWCAAFETERPAATVSGIAARAGLDLDVAADIEAFCARDDLPEFDYVGVTADWAVLGENAQAAVLDLVERRLRPGGAFYANYSVEPGAGVEGPLRLMVRSLLGDVSPAAPDFAARFGAALEQAAQALTAAPILQTHHIEMAAAIAELLEEPDAQVTWRRWFDPRVRPVAFAETAARMAGAGLAFATSAEFAHHVPEINLTPRQRAFLDGFDDAATRQQLIDLISYSWGRADYWLKAPRRLSADDRADALRRTRLVLAGPVERFDWHVRGLLGRIALSREVYAPIIDRLAEIGAATVDELATAGGRGLESAAEAAGLLVAAGIARPADGDRAEETAAACARLNRELRDFAAAGGAARSVASPRLEGGLDVTPRELRFMAARAAGADGPESLSRACAKMEGVAAPDSISAAEIARDAGVFDAESVNYRALGVL